MFDLQCEQKCFAGIVGEKVRTPTDYFAPFEPASFVIEAAVVVGRTADGPSAGRGGCGCVVDAPGFVLLLLIACAEIGASTFPALSALFVEFGADVTLSTSPAALSV